MISAREAVFEVVTLRTRYATGRHSAGQEPTANATAMRISVSLLSDGIAGDGVRFVVVLAGSDGEGKRPQAWFFDDEQASTGCFRRYRNKAPGSVTHRHWENPVGLSATLREVKAQAGPWWPVVREEIYRRLRPVRRAWLDGCQQQWRQRAVDRFLAGL